LTKNVSDFILPDISEHGENPWRTRRCDPRALLKERLFSKKPLSRSSGMGRRWRGGKPEDLSGMGIGHPDGKGTRINLLSQKGLVRVFLLIPWIQNRKEVNPDEESDQLQKKVQKSEWNRTLSLCSPHGKEVTKKADVKV